MKCPFSGKECSAPKIIHITDVEENKSVGAFSVCLGCKMEKPVELPKFVSGLLQILHHANAFVAIPGIKPPCPHCGASLQDIIQMNKLGCGGCYEYYKLELLPVLFKNHHSAKHVGKRPLALNEVELQKELAEAIKTENYEKAASIKKLLEEGLS